MELKISKGRARGVVQAPPSKSMAHRMLLCAGLAEGESVVHNVAFSEDILATIDVLRAIGATCRIDGDTVTVTGADARQAHYDGVLSCRESGSTLRFCIPLLLLSGNEFTLTGKGRLLQRPQDVYVDLCERQGLLFERSADTIRLRGPLHSGEYVLPGDISSQFISGLLFALPLKRQDSTIHILPPVESRSYIDITIQALGTFGVQARWDESDENTLLIPGGQRYLPREVTVEGDYSNAAFFGALAAFGDDVTVAGLQPSLQGDRVYARCFEQLRQGMATIDVTDCPDLGPILMAAAAVLHGVVLTGTRRLRIKESDRGVVMAQELQKLGVHCSVQENTIEIFPGIQPPERPLLGHNDHRIVMSCAVLLTRTGGVISGAEAVTKSFPGFFDRLRELGIEVTELENHG